VFTGGGTAGHVLPHFAVAYFPESALKSEIVSGKCEVHYLGSSQGMERNLIEQSNKGWKYHPIPTGKLRRYLSFRNFLDVFNVVAGFLVAVKKLYKISPQVVFSKGGFVAAPVVWAAWFLRVPVVVHESDATPALATKLSYFFASKILLSFRQTLKSIPEKYRNKVVECGVPLRAELFENRNVLKQQNVFNLNLELPTLLVFGGSLGAGSLNEAVEKHLPELIKRFNILHVVGKGKTFHTTENYSGYKQFEYLNEKMADAYAIADFALCRAGASSIFELLAARIPMLLVPLGLKQSRGDQIVNAKYFEASGWALRIADEEIGTRLLIEKLYELTENAEKMKLQMENAPSWKAAQTVGNIILSCKKN
jgi:UDP-N-acetylglucosamine--N-acetylmuramyl-(pentapeptide) pyrophosphoryl-undecaprenol N-acetylglucosamine transferase